MKLFDRVCKVTIKRTVKTRDERRFFVTEVDQIEVTGLRVAFSVERHLSGQPNTCEVTITNLAPATRAQLDQRENLVVSLAAGYDNTPRHLFTGDVRVSSSVREGPDWHTTLQLGDGSRAYAHARATRSYRGGTTVLTVLKDAAKSMGLLLPPEVEGSPELRASFAGGYALEGPSRTELTRLLAPFGYTWSIQDGRLQILRDDQFAPGAEREVSLDTGMIGSPTYSHPQPGAKGTKSKKRTMLNVDSLLYPELVPGCAILVKSLQINGRFKLDSVTHTGDTHGDEWTTSMEAKA